MNLYPGHIGFFQVDRGGKAQKKFAGRQVQGPADSQDVVRGKDYIDIAAAGGETGDLRVTAEFHRLSGPSLLGMMLLGLVSVPNRLLPLDCPGGFESAISVVPVVRIYQKVKHLTKNNDGNVTIRRPAVKLILTGAMEHLRPSAR